MIDDLPTQQTVQDTLEHYLSKQEDWVRPPYNELARELALTSEQRQRLMRDGRNHWENRVQWARDRLVRDGRLDGSRRGWWKLKG